MGTIVVIDEIPKGYHVVKTEPILKGDLSYHWETRDWHEIVEIDLDLGLEEHSCVIRKDLTFST